MKYQIQGETLPVVVCQLEGGEKMITEGGGMSWMSPNMKMETTTNGGLGKAFGRMFSGEKMFQNVYTAQGGSGMIAFASSFPGSIKAYEIAPGQEMIFQKSAFLAAEAGVELSVFFNKKFSSGLFGGEGFIMQKISGYGRFNSGMRGCSDSRACANLFYLVLCDEERSYIVGQRRGRIVFRHGYSHEKTLRPDSQSSRNVQGLHQARTRNACPRDRSAQQCYARRARRQARSGKGIDVVASRAI